MEEKKYVTGMFVKRNEKAPQFVICDLSVKTDDFIQFLKENTNEKGYVNLQVLKARIKARCMPLLTLSSKKQILHPPK